MSQLSATEPLQLAEVLATLDDRGRGFEELCAWFLVNDPEWRARVEKVWRWADWPERWGPDRGIDLVARLHDGRLLAVQCKHFDPQHTITKAEVDSFLSESNRVQFCERLLISTTSRIAEGARQVIDAQEKPVSLALRDRLEEALLDWATYLSEDPGKWLRKQPEPHQQRALEAVVRAFERADRGQLLMPCGTGKTLTSLWTAEQLEARQVLVLLPTLALLRQTAQVWRKEASERFELLKVCSEKGEGDDEIDAADLTPSEVGGPVTTDPQTIAAFLHASGRRWIFGTYQSSARIAEALALLPGHRLDLVICDEAHRCAGVQSSSQKTVLDNNKIPSRRRLFATATPTVFVRAAKDKAANAHTKIASMDDRAVFGHVFFRLSFKQAVEEKLLCPYQVVLMPVSDEDVAELVRRRTIVTPDGGDHVTDAYNFASQIACLRTMRRFDCRRLVAFHPLVDDSKRFADDVTLAAELLDPAERPASFHARHVDGYMSRPVRDGALQRFMGEDATPQLLSNVRLLAEGVDVPGIDAICLVDTHRNPSAIVQAVGRAVRRAPGKTVGTVLLPVLVRDGQSLEEAMRTSEHRPVLEVLAALRSIDTEIRHTIDAIRLELGPRRRRQGGSGQWVLDAPTEVGEEFADAVEVCLVELLNARTSTRKARSQEHTVREGQPGDLPYTFYWIDWSDVDRIIEIGLEFAMKCRDAYPSEPVGTRASYEGFPVQDWWDGILQRWEVGALNGDVKQRCAALFNWLTVAPKQHPVARRELAELDPVPLADRLDEWLYTYGPPRGDKELDKLARAGAVGRSGGIPAEWVVEHIPFGLSTEQRAHIAIEMLRIAGSAMYATVDEHGMIAKGFVDALHEPRRDHGLDVIPTDPPRGRIACYAYGWEVGQDAMAALEANLPAAPAAALPSPRRGRGRNRTRRRRPSTT